MNLGQRQALAWLEASRGELFVLAFGEEADDPLYTESPEEQALPDDEPQEHLIRVFTTRQEANFYREAIEAMYPMKFCIKQFPNLETLWPELMDARRIYENTLGVSVHVTLASMRMNEHPQNLDTIFSTTQLQN